MTLTYVDAGVLIVAARGGEARSERALTLLFDAGRTFAASAFLKLEVIPQAVFHKQANEVAFYERFFERELFTLEKPARSIYRARAVKVIHRR